MKKRVLSTLIALALVALCNVPSFAALEIKLSHSGPTPAVGATNDEGCKAFKEYVEKASGGGIVVNVFPNNQLGNEREQMEGVQMGTIQMCSISTGTLSTLDSYMLVTDIPYLFASKQVAYKFLDGRMGDYLREHFKEQSGTHILAFGENGFRHFTNRVRPVKSPSDLKGLKMRTQENPAHIAMMKSFGSTPTPIPFGELYTALSQGVVDGQENPVSLTESSRFHEVQKYLTLDGHFYSPFVLIANGDFYNGLTPDQQKIIQDGAKAWSSWQREFNSADEIRSLEEMKKAGLEVTELSADELKTFRDAAQGGALPLIRGEVGDDFVKEVLAAVAEAEK
jgi:C4-dicarboxylate-binding protein DctP